MFRVPNFSWFYFCLCLITSTVCEPTSGKYALVTYGTFEESLLLFRSALFFSPKGFETHLCISSLDYDGHSKELVTALGVTIHMLHNTSNLADGSTQRNNLFCMNQVADHYNLLGSTGMPVIFIGANFVATNDFYQILTDHGKLSSPSLWCAVKVPTISHSSLTGGICEMDIMVISAAIGTSLYAALNATAFLNITADVALEAATRSLSMDIRILAIARHVVRASQMWYGSDTGQDVVLVEIDRYNHVIHPIDELCTLSVHVEWPQVYNTAAVTMNVFKRIDEDDQALSVLAGCADHVLKSTHNSAVPTEKSAQEPVAPMPRQRVFDSVMLNDELPLLRLRLDYLANVVDHFIVIEARRTFTGRPKPLYYAENMHLFAEYAERIIHVTVELPYETIKHNKQVWLNEYYSRNAVADALEYAHATEEDIILLNDIDEIPHPRAVTSLRALLSSTANHSRRLNSNYATHDDRIYKLYTHTYMYNFSCSMHTGGLLSAGAPTATTLGISRQLASKHAAQSFADPTSHAAIMHAIEKHHITLTRLYQQTTRPYPLQNVLNPGGWHLTFFGGVSKIKRKLESYSHQNFVQQFILKNVSGELEPPLLTDSCNSGGDCSGAAIAGGNGIVASRSKIENVFPVEFITEEMSIELIADRVATGRAIDHRSKQQCQTIHNEHVDAETAKVKAMWDDIVTSGKYEVV